MLIIAKLSFWIMKPERSIFAQLLKTDYEHIVMDAFAQFKRDGYVEKLKTSITSESLPYDKNKLLAFLHNMTAQS